MPEQPSGFTYHYGTDPSQWAELTLPVHRRPGVIVIIHGGYWRSAYDAGLGRPMAADLAARGWICWNLEYRRAGNGGGWPQTFEDVAAGIDHLAVAARRHGFRTGPVVALGHSAGGQLAVWAGGRDKMPPGAPGAAPGIRLAAVVSLSGLLDLAQARELGLSAGAVVNLLGSSPAEDPLRYRLADPMEAVPLSIPVHVLHGETDSVVPASQAGNYVRAARAAGAQVSFRSVPGGHFAMIEPGTPAWAAVLAVLEECCGTAGGPGTDKPQGFPIP